MASANVHHDHQPGEDQPRARHERARVARRPAPVPEPPEPPALLTPEDLAARWKVSTRHLRRMVNRGELPAVELGHVVRFHPDDVAAVEARRRADPRRYDQ